MPEYGWRDVLREVYAEWPAFCTVFGIGFGIGFGGGVLCTGLAVLLW